MATASSQDDPEEREAKNADWSGRPLVVAVQSDDLVDARRVREIVRLVERAAEEEVSAVVLELDLSGSGAAGERQRVLDALSKSKSPIIAYVNTNATGPQWTSTPPDLTGNNSSNNDLALYNIPRKIELTLSFEDDSVFTHVFNIR